VGWSVGLPDGVEQTGPPLLGTPFARICLGDHEENR
jgi:hypothetical protein